MKYKQLCIRNKTLSSCVLTASGTFGYGLEYQDLCDYNKIGAIVCKTITLDPRAGNQPPRLKEIKNSSLNSIGLANVGVHAFVQEKLALFKEYPCKCIVNIAGKDTNEFCEIVKIIEDSQHADEVWGWELNLSCPNVSGGTNFGYAPKLIDEVVSNVRACTEKPLIVKLPPSIHTIAELGERAEHSGADAISAINTIPAMSIDTATQKPEFARKTAGLAGEAIFPIALAMVHALSLKVTVPVIGIGGISSTDQAIQFLLAGASAIQIGSANFKNPQLIEQCYDAIQAFKWK